MKKNSFKTNKFRNLQQALALLILVLAGALTSCELIPGSKCDDDPKGCGFGNDTTCNTFATAEQITCGGGEFGNTWLKLDDGTYLQPFENTTQVTTLEAGKRYRIGFDYLSTTKPHPNQMVCLAVVPPSKPVRLNCLVEADPTGNCDTYATATDVQCGYGAWNSMWLKLDNGEYLQPWANVSGVPELVEGQRYKVGYQVMQKDSRYDNQAICHALPIDSLAWNPHVVAITCLNDGVNTTGSN